MPLRPIAVLALLALTPGAAVSAVSPEWAATWRADLAFLADTLPRVHANLFHTLPRDSFEAEIERLSARLQGLDHAAITVDLARIVARVGDGHTRLTLPFDSAAAFFTGHSATAPPKVPGLVFRHLPVRLRFFADGLFVVRADGAHRAILGGRVVSIGRRTVDEAIAAVEPTVQRDNAQQVRHLLPVHLVVPEILAARGVIDDPQKVRIVVVDAKGARHEAVLAPLPVGTAPDWIEARDPAKAPLSEKHPARRHWFEKVEGAPALYARYHEVMDDDDETVAEFSEKLFAALGRDGADRLILDLRGNVGGNGFLNRPLIRGALSSPSLQRPGRLFVLADRATFSAAMMLLTDLEKLTPAIVAGEGSGASPNGYGDSRRIRLPGTGLTVRASTLYWQTSDPRDARDGIEPHLPVEARFANWRSGHDVVLDSTLALTRDGADPAGKWTGVLSIDYQRLAMSLEIARQGAGWSARVTAPDLGLKDAAADEVTFSGGELRFTVPGPVQEFRARMAPGALLGIARFQGSDLAFVLGPEN